MQLTLHQHYVAKVFLSRLSEWQAATILFMWGLVLMFPDSSFNTAAAYAAFRTFTTGPILGSVLMVGGFCRLIVLAVNGFWQPMYFARAAAATCSMVLWIALANGFIQSGALGTWLAVVPVLAVFEAANVFRAMADAAAVTNENRRLHAVASRG